MHDRLPPLTALRAFEAAARHMSFAKAAEELHVTPAALSFQIKSLEDHLGQPVFRRLNRAIELTEVGRTLFPGAQEGFDRLKIAWRAALRVTDSSTLTVTAGPAFTAKWLAPRLFHFAQAHPEIELRFSASLKLVDFIRDEIDVAIRFGAGDDSGIYSKALISEWITPMMSPAMAETIKEPADLNKLTLLHQDVFPFIDESINWATWFKAAGIGTPPEGGPRFSHADHAHDAAISGSGVVLGRYSLAEKALRDGQLVAPFKIAIDLPYKYRFVCLRGTETRPNIAAFEQWLHSEISVMETFRDKHDFIDADELSE